MEYLGLSSMERRRARQLLRSGEPLSEQEAEASKLNRAALGLGVHNFVFSMVMLGGFVGFTVYEGVAGSWGTVGLAITCSMNLLAVVVAGWKYLSFKMATSMGNTRGSTGST